MCQRVRIEFADAAMRACYKGKRQRVPVAVGVGRFTRCGVGMQRAPVLAVVGGDVGAVGANGDPGFRVGVAGDGGAEAVGKSARKIPCRAVIDAKGAIRRALITKLPRLAARTPPGQPASDRRYSFVPRKLQRLNFS